MNLRNAAPAAVLPLRAAVVGAMPAPTSWAAITQPKTTGASSVPKASAASRRPVPVSAIGGG